MSETKEYSKITNLQEFIGFCESGKAVEILAKKQADGTWTVTVTFP
jgi:hypothetical protein